MRRLFAVPALLAACSVVTFYAPARAADPPRVAFVTSVTGSGDLATWPGAGGETGLAAADAVCRARAGAAGLDRAQSFVAWISDSSDDAYCRVHGLTGKKEARCGRASLPATAGPWVRPDGAPFSGPIATLTGEDIVFHPLELDENGELLPLSSVLTNTTPSGELDSRFSDSCSDWTSTDPSSRIINGTTYRTSIGWTSSGAPSCDNSFRLFCFETGSGSGPELPAISERGRLAFVTSVFGNGDLGSWEAGGGANGLAAGDAICGTLAREADLAQADSFRAWLSDSGTDARDRFEHDGPWVRPDGVRIASGLADLTDGSLETSINVTEEGEYVGNWGVWTGTSPGGVARAETCVGWTNGTDTASGSVGEAHGNWLGWTRRSVAGCDFIGGRLYCLSDSQVPAPPPGPWMTSSAVPGFRAKARITAGSTVIPARQESECIAETLCVSGAVPGRSELFLRVDGPKPNGYLWPTLVKFSTSRVEVWIEQTATAELRYYVLDPVVPGQRFITLDGLAHKLGFLPEAEAADGAGGALQQGGAPAAGRSSQQPDPPAGPWLSSPGIAGFEVKARITGGPTSIPGTEVGECIDEALCIAGALPSRADVFVRVVGPKPNGHLWPTLVKFSTSRIEVWIRQQSTGEIRYYDLDPVSPGEELLALEGLADKMGFLP